MKKVSWIVVIAGAVVGLAAVVLTHLGNPANMGFCIACFLRDITGAVGMHSAAKVQYVRPEIIGLVLGAFIMSVATKEFRAKAGSSPATRFVLGAFVMIGALAFLGCPLRMVLRIGGGDLNAVVGLAGFTLGIFIGIQFLKRGFSLKRAYPVGKGEGGVLPLTAEYLAAANQLAHEEDIPLMMDEVQIGNGRSGKLYGYMNFDVQPDIVSTAKGLGGGLPIGACLLGEKVQNVLGFGDHGSTYGGNPVCCAGGVSIIERLTDDFLAEVRKKSDYVFKTLTGAPGIESVTGLGLMIGVKPVAPAADVVKACMERGVLCLTAKNKVRLLPALNIPMEDLKFAVEAIQTVAAQLA